MSAYIVSHNTIRAIAAYGNGPRDATWVRLADGQTLSFDQTNDLQAACDILLAENYRSVHERYPDTITNPDNTPGTTAEIGRPCVFHFSSYHPRTPVVILKLCDCYEYQACETDDYHESDAAKIIEAIRARAIRNLDGYDKAPWGLD